MNTDPNHPVSGPDPDSRRRWRSRAVAIAAGTVLLGAAVFGATAASAADPSPAPAAGTSSTGTPSPAAPASPGSGAAKQQGKHPLAQVLRRELRIDIQGKAGFGDKAHELAYLLIHHPAGFGKLPANLQADLKTLEAAAAPERDADAAKIKDTALSGGYGDRIQQEAKAVQAKLAKAPATQAPATPGS